MTKSKRVSKTSTGNCERAIQQSLEAGCDSKRRMASDVGAQKGLSPLTANAVWNLTLHPDARWESEEVHAK